MIIFIQHFFYLEIQILALILAYIPVRAHLKDLVEHIRNIIQFRVPRLCRGCAQSQDKNNNVHMFQRQRLLCYATLVVHRILLGPLKQVHRFHKANAHMEKIPLMPVYEHNRSSLKEKLSLNLRQCDTIFNFKKKAQTLYYKTKDEQSQKMRDKKEHRSFTWVLDMSDKDQLNTTTFSGLSPTLKIPTFCQAEFSKQHYFTNASSCF